MGADEEPSSTQKRGRDEEELAAEKRPREEGSDGASLLGLASYEDDDDEEQAARGHSNGRRVEKEEEDEEDEDDARRAPERRSRQVELRRDCPYLDTVNRQVSRILLSFHQMSNWRGLSLLLLILFKSRNESHHSHFCYFIDFTDHKCMK
jgi:hypothetical protein